MKMKRISDSFVLVLGLLVIGGFWFILFKNLPIGLLLVILGAIFSRTANSATSKNELHIGTIGSWLYPAGIFISFVQNGFLIGVLSIGLTFFVYSMSKNSSFGKWQWLVDGISVPNSRYSKDVTYLRKYIDLLFIKDNIDPVKFRANYFVMNEGGIKLAKNSNLFEDDPEGLDKLLEQITPSIKKVDYIGSLPLGLSNLFVSSYPDVALWIAQLADGELERIFKKEIVTEMIGEDEKIQPRYLRLLINEYLNRHNKLECQL